MHGMEWRSVENHNSGRSTSHSVELCGEDGNHTATRLRRLCPYACRTKAWRHRSSAAWLPATLQQQQQQQRCQRQQLEQPSLPLTEVGPSTLSAPRQRNETVRRRVESGDDDLVAGGQPLENTWHRESESVSTPERIADTDTRRLNPTVHVGGLCCIRSRKADRSTTQISPEHTWRRCECSCYSSRREICRCAYISAIHRASFSWSQGASYSRFTVREFS